MAIRRPTGLLAVLTNFGDPAKEAECNEWYSRTHVPEILATGSYYTAARYESTRPVAEGQPKYLALYLTDWKDPLEAFKHMRATAKAAPPPTMTRWASETLSYLGPEDPITASREALGPEHKGVMFYFTKLLDPAKMAELHRFYKTAHIPDVIKTPGMLTYHRFENVRPGETERQFVLVCEVDDPAVEPVFERMGKLFPPREDKEARRRLIAEGRLTTVTRPTFHGNFRRIL